MIKTKMAKQRKTNMTVKVRIFKSALLILVKKVHSSFLCYYFFIL